MGVVWVDGPQDAYGLRVVGCVVDFLLEFGREYLFSLDYFVDFVVFGGVGGLFGLGLVVGVGLVGCRHSQLLAQRLDQALN